MSLGGSIQMHTREPQYVHPEQQGAVALSKPGKAASPKYFRIISLLLDII